MNTCTETENKLQDMEYICEINTFQIKLQVTRYLKSALLPWHIEKPN